MTFSTFSNAIATILLPLVLLGLVYLFIRWQGRRRLRQLNEEARQAGADLVSFLKESHSKLEQVVNQVGVDREQKRREIETILAAMASRNIEGNLDELIQDDRQWALAEIDRQAAA